MNGLHAVCCCSLTRDASFRSVPLATQGHAATCCRQNDSADRYISGKRIDIANRHLRVRSTHPKWACSNLARIDLQFWTQHRTHTLVTKRRRIQFAFEHFCTEPRSERGTRSERDACGNNTVPERRSVVGPIWIGHTQERPPYGGDTVTQSNI